MSLNPEILEQSFEKVILQAEEFSTSFYENLLSDYPQLRPLFAKSNMVEQRQKLFSSLVLIVENIRNPEKLTNSLRGLGKKHIKYGVIPSHYPMVGNSLLKTFESYLGSSWTPEVKQAWIDAYEAIASLMLDEKASDGESMTKTVSK